jgi:aspartate aminotransferase
VLGLAKDIPGIKTNVPQGAFYVFPDVSSYLGKNFNGKTIDKASDLAMFILNEGHVATVGGDAFGAPNCLRISFAASDENLVEAMRRIKECLAKLK